MAFLVLREAVKILKVNTAYQYILYKKIFRFYELKNTHYILYKAYILISER